MMMIMELKDHQMIKKVVVVEDQYEIEQIEKDFELILMVLVYDDYYDEMMMMMNRKILMLMIEDVVVSYDDLIDLFVVMNVEMNQMNDVSDYYDVINDLNDYVNVIGNDFVNENALN